MMLQPIEDQWKFFFFLTIVLCVSQSRLFLILSQFISLPYILPLVIRIIWLYQFSSPSYYFYFYYDNDYYYLMIIIIIINIIILCVSFKHAKRCKIWICDPWYCKEEFLILDFKCWNTFRCNGYWDTIE